VLKCAEVCVQLDIWLMSCWWSWSGGSTGQTTCV